MQFFLRCTLIVVCVTFAFTSCNKTEVEPTPVEKPNAILAEIPAPSGTILSPSSTSGETTYEYMVTGNSNTSRTWLRVNGFTEGCTCLGSDCPKFTIKDTNGAILFDSSCQTTDKFVRVPGTVFSVIVNHPSWIPGSSDVNITPLNW